MKNLIQLIIALTLLISSNQIFGQEFKQDKGSTKLVNITQVFGKIILSEHSGSQIIVKAEGFEQKELPEKAKGLRQINSNGVDNTNVGLSMAQKGEAYEFTSVNMPSKPITYYFKIPKGMDVKIDNSKMFHNNRFYLNTLEIKEIARDAAFIAKEELKDIKKGLYFSYDSKSDKSEKKEKPEKPEKSERNKEKHIAVEVQSFSGELEIKTMTDGISLKDVTGPLTVNSMSGPITIVFSSVSQSAPITITSYSAEIDITMPSSTKANLKMSSMNGDIYTDFDIEFNEEKDNKGLRYIGGGSNISGTVNGGGVDIMLKALSDNIYLRKK
jgi:hypothetical protein